MGLLQMLIQGRGGMEGEKLTIQERFTLKEILYRAQWYIVQDKHKLGPSSCLFQVSLLLLVQ
jgi:hypothetical protein